MNPKLLKKTAHDAEELKNDVLGLVGIATGIADDKIIVARKKLRSSLGPAMDACEHGAQTARKFVNGHAVETAVVVCLAGIATGWLMNRRHN